MKTGAFVCSCADTCNLDLEGVRDGVADVEVVASSSTLCEDGLPAMGKIVDEYDLDQLLVTAPESRCQRRIEALADEKGLHPGARIFLDHREMAGWIHGEAEATAKTARLVNATYAGLAAESRSRTVSREAGDRVAVVGDPETAAALDDDAEVTLLADGREFDGSEVDLEDVTLERGRIRAVGGRYGGFEVRLRSRVTEDCISCMKCVVEGPDGAVTSRPVDIHPDAPDGEWTDVCPTDAIEMDGVERTLEFDQVVYPAADRATRGGRLGFYTAPIDAATIAAVERLLGGIEKPAHLDLEMDVCASGASSTRGCNECAEACPHGAVERPRIDEVAFDEVACQDCGACTSSCPTGAVRLREPSNERIAREVEALLEPADSGGWLFGNDPAIETQVIAFVCSERAEDALRAYGRRAAGGESGIEYPPILPVSVGCTDTVGEAHAVHALAAGADGVAILGCGDGCKHSGPDPKAALVERLERATTDLGLGERVAFFAPDPDDHEPFLEWIGAFVDGLEATPVPAGEYESTGTIDDPERSNPPFDSHAWTLESVRRITAHVDPERDVIRGLTDFGRMEVTDDCALTPTCSTMCPTDAIRRTDGGDLQFNHERCVNCGLCESGCPESAITMRDGLELSALPENRGDDAWETVLEGEMLECVRCGDPFTSERTAAKIEDEVGDLVAGVAPGTEHSVFEYCDECRAKLLFEHG